MSVLANAIALDAAPVANAAARKRFHAWTKTLNKDEQTKLGGLLADNEQLSAFIAGVFAGSPFLFDLVSRDVPRFLRLLGDTPEHSFDRLITALSALGKTAPDDPALMHELRLMRQEQALLIALADLGGVWNVTTVIARLSDFAEHAVNAVLDILLRRAAGRGDIQLPSLARPQKDCGYFLLAMGKLGAGELNYSSDIDLIAFYEQDKVALRRPDEHQAFFVRLTQQLSRILSHRDHDGFVFRVDLRLRPDPGTYPLAISTGLARNYYESIGQNWERAAYIKARPIAGDREAADLFLSDVAPFIWRKYLDYAAIAEIHAMKRMIEEAKELTGADIAGRDLKLGAGGIREIEFFVQTQQLIGGGRDQSLRQTPTLDVMAALERRLWISAGTRRDLTAAYHELRRLEHRLQMVDDAQTHRLPDEPAALEAFARFAGFKAKKNLEQVVRDTVACVRRHYSVLFEDKPKTAAALQHIDFSSDVANADALTALSDIGFKDPGRIAGIIQGWQCGRYPATRSTPARARLAEITPRLLEAISGGGEPEATLVAFDRFLSQLPYGVQFFSLLRSNPGLLDLITRILSTAPRLSQDLARRPRLIDGLIDSLQGETGDPLAELASQVERGLGHDVDYGEALDQARRTTQEMIFLVGTHIVARRLSPLAAGTAYSRIADVIIEALHNRVLAEHVEHYGMTPVPAHAIIALGRLGSREMTATSDVDLLLIYEDDYDAPSNGRKSLYAAEYYTRLTQRLVAALSAPTAEGIAYAVDFRLRPSGNKGPLASSLRGFREYHAGEAWTWERMALTRARIVSTNDPAFGEQLNTILARILVQPQRPEQMARDVVDMRMLLLKEKPPRDLWDIRQRLGGLTDIDFFSQYLVLRHGADHRGLAGNFGDTLFDKAASAALITAVDAEKLSSAWRFFTHLLQLSRLCLDPGVSLADASPALRALLVETSGLSDVPAVARALETHARAVRGVLARHWGSRAYDQLGHA